MEAGMVIGDHDHLVEQRGQLLRELADIGDLRQGSLRTQYRKCGKPNCHCARDGAQGHGPYWLLTWLDRDTGKSRGRTIPSDAVATAPQHTPAAQSFNLNIPAARLGRPRRTLKRQQGPGSGSAAARPKRKS